MSDKFLKSDLRNALSRNGVRGNRVFLQPRYAITLGNGKSKCLK
jgi:hypothetical protein